MPIIIDHRFIDRLTPNRNRKLSTVIVGTFNPGIPDKAMLTSAEKAEFERIECSPKFQKFNEVMNFYDRPQNRFWKVHDYFHDKEFYSNNPIESRNYRGLKFYVNRGITRREVFDKQEKYCQSNGIFITDLVRQIRPTSFQSIYDNFPDSIIERCDCDWNTDHLLPLLKLANPRRIIVNFKVTSQIPRLSGEVTKIQEVFGDKVVHVLSTSGTAGNTYKALVDDWGKWILNRST